MNNIDSDHMLALLTSEAMQYQALSAMYSDPKSDKFSLLRDPEFREQAIEAAQSLASQKNGPKELLDNLNLAFEYASHVGEGLDHQYSLIFGHTLSNELSPYEMEFLQNDEIFYRTQRLADLQGYYAAFGFSVNSVERADHISVESEFMALLLAKQAYAVANNLGEDALEVCKDARVKFSREHYSDWVKKLAINLTKLDNQPFYAAVGRFTIALLN